jgi:putative methanogenesis marker protein 3
MTRADQMIVRVNNEQTDVKAGATLSDAVKDRPYKAGSLIAVLKPPKTIREETKEFEIVTPKGVMALELNDSDFASLFRNIYRQAIGKGIRWQTSKVLAVGSFPTELPTVHGPTRYSKYDCFFALGGFDARTTYIMIAKLEHEGQYGIQGGVLGRITSGRHILHELAEGETLLDIRPKVQERREMEALVTDDLSLPLEDGTAVETFLGVRLDERSPVSCEHLLVVTGPGIFPITDRTEAYSACSINLDVALVAEHSTVRDEGAVTVRHDGAGTGRIYVYKSRRQIATTHNHVGTVTNGLELLRRAPQGAKVTIVSDPARIMVIGMTEAEGQRFAEGRGLRAVRTGDTADESVIVEQDPELTIEALAEKSVEMLGVRPERVFDIVIHEPKAPQSARYLRKMTGLNHKPIGTIKVHFTYPDMPLITFEGNARVAMDLVPENPFQDEAGKGDIAVTNMSRPNRGLIGIRLDASDEFGPTGEERYGTNLVGKFVGPLDHLMKDINEGDIIYVREVSEAPKPSRRRSAKKNGGKEEKPKGKARRNGNGNGRNGKNGN